LLSFIRAFINLSFLLITVRWGIVAVAWGIVARDLIYEPLLFVALKNTLGTNIRKLFRSILPIVASTVVMAVIVSIGKLVFANQPNSLPILILLISIGVMSYMLMLRLLDPSALPQTINLFMQLLPGEIE
jgi:hypothetical protein